MADGLFSDGVVLLENPRGDNKLDLDKLRKVCSSIFATNCAQLRFFSGGTGENSRTIKAAAGVFSLIQSGPASICCVHMY